MVLTIINKILVKDESGYLERSRMFLEYKNWAAAFEPSLTRARTLREGRLLKFAKVM